MTDSSSLSRTPVEIWERILLEVIAVDHPPVFHSTCHWSRYLAYKRTFGDLTNEAYRHEYYASQNQKRVLRLVCKAWRAFADRWDVCDRWIRVTWPWRKVTEEPWRGVQRVEFALMKTGGAGGWWDGEEWCSFGRDMCSAIFQWKMLGVPGGQGTKLTRLELLHLTKETFVKVFDALCSAGTGLLQLRALSILVQSRKVWACKRISEHFPRLLHLGFYAGDSYSLDFDERTARAREGLEDAMDLQPQSDISDGLILRDLETLFLYPKSHFLLLQGWRLPALRQLHIHPASSHWQASLYPFIIRHAAGLEVLDLDDTTHASNGGLVSSNDLPDAELNLWYTLPNLRLLRCSIRSIKYVKIPESHPIECLVDTDPIEQRSEFTRVVSPWVRDDGGKIIKKLVLYGAYLSKQAHLKDLEPVPTLVRQLRWNGTEVVNPSGHPWVTPL